MRLTTLATVSCLAVLAAGCVNPKQQANMVAALNDAANQVSDLRGDVSSLQIQVDSLQQVVAKQDTTIKRIAAYVNMPLAQ
jgi:peptidoglycan hydrolase CwlO-like protein